MASVRRRITFAYGLAMVGTMVIFAIVFGIERRSAAMRELLARARTTATVAHRILERQGVQGVTLDTASAVGGMFTPGVTTLLDALPDYVIVGDTARVLYWSGRVRQLSDAVPPATPQRPTPLSERSTLTRAAFTMRDSLSNPVVNLTSDDVVLVAHLIDPPLGGGVRRVVVGVSTRSLTSVTNEIVDLFFVTSPFIILVSIATAWTLAGGLLRPMEEMGNAVEAITDGKSLHRRVVLQERGDEIYRLGETVNAMIARLESSFTALRRFTADASHELKTPLTVLRADVERAMHATVSSMDQAVALEEALQQVSRMAGLVDSLLTLARADEGRFEVMREPVKLEPLVREVGETAQILGEEAGLTVSLPQVDEVEVLGDTERLRQLFLNLVTNAIKYTPKGGSVDVSLERRNGEAVFTVRDTGVGIAGADLPHIFDRFWRADLARTRGTGVGLGLSISQWIAQAHGGTIEVTSRLGRGSTFSVLLPSVGDGYAAPVAAAPSLPPATEA